MIVEVCAEVKQGENVLISTDTNKLSIAESLASECQAVGAETVICIMTPRQMHGNEPPPVMAAAMKAAQVIIAPTTYSMSHTDARLAAKAAGDPGEFGPFILGELTKWSRVVKEANIKAE